MQAIILAYTV